ncbi:methyl-accepting chemotaxis protein [Clostridium thermobutyricum]|uniref:methyl-accepting chemotaxis protein n=1 Tax=Clostridium thermobutyricum TaxID=29372 RepID=UPI0025890C9E|nr:methyl-accepting chemotaxis protein [Clostridium thermobutyricum]
MGFFNRKSPDSSKISDNNNEVKTIETIVEKHTIPPDMLKELKNLNSYADNISSSFNDINSSLSNLSNSSVSQSNEIENAATILNNFKTSMEGLAFNVSNAHAKALDTDKLATDGLNSINELDNSLNDLEEAFSVSSCTVDALVDKLESVNSITDSISQIASQTNLLSLNAAIEAARAGEAGKGFSVVAGEVRKLAENSKQAVQSITAILEEIKGDILKASVAMNTGNKAVETQHNTIVVTKQNFSDIKTSISSATTEIDECIKNLVTASEKTNEVFNSVEKANAISQENTSLTEEIASTMDVQATSVNNLNSTISKIKSMANKYN